MLPISLKVRNFLSYRENVPTLYLENVHVACLSGANGNGKSALLDAITWALWGRARGQRQEQLLHQGQQEMQVDLEFEVHEQRYRVIRRYSKSRRQGVSALELHNWSGHEYRAVTGNTIASTQALLQRLINMDYETFVNSAFLLQGRADIFTMATPSQRKDVLGKVLGLELYDRLEDRAKMYLKNANLNLEASSSITDRLQVQLDRLPAIQEAKSLAETGLEDAKKMTDVLNDKLKLIVTQLTKLEGQKQTLSEVMSQLDQIKLRVQEEEKEIEEMGTKLVLWGEVLERKREIETRFGELVSARNRLSALQGAVMHARELEQKLHIYEQRISQAKAEIEGDIRIHQSRLAEELKPSAQGIGTIVSQINETEAMLRDNENEAEALAVLYRQNSEKIIELRGLEEYNTSIELNGKEIAAKIQILHSSHEHDINCPLCGSAVDPTAMSRIELNYQEEIKSQRDQYALHKERIGALKEQVDSFKAQNLSNQKSIDDKRRSLDARLIELKQRHEESLLSQRELSKTEDIVEKLRINLDKANYALEDQSAAATLREQLKGLGYEPEEHLKAESLVQELGLWEVEHRKLEEANVRINEVKNILMRQQSRVDQDNREIVRLDGILVQTNKELVQLPNYLTQKTQVEEELRLAVQQRDSLQSELGSLAHQLDEIYSARKEHSRLSEEREHLLGQVALHSDLAHAFGKSGVQALLIEAAIPRLEEDANQLLRRMTDGRMSLKLETQRQRRAPGSNDELVETLDILIADDTGTRNYELFSGGEGFRINFALRIALSKLLAWRAGAPLSTLFIDEGFGTQDVDGRDRILDVLKSIEPDFQRILIITHMEEIKEAFPVRIDVIRTAMGSTFSLS